MAERPEEGSGPSVTRADVARVAGVSSAVVSYVVNGGPRAVARETAARVEAAIAELGYRPNAAARALKVGRSSTLALILPGSVNPFFTEFALRVEEAASSRGMALIMANSDGDPARTLRLISDLTARQVDGLIVFGLAPPVDAQVKGPERRTPVVFVGARDRGGRHQTIDSDLEDGAYQAVDHLLRVHDHSEVGLIIGQVSTSAIDPRQRGWERAHRDLNRSPGLVLGTSFTREGGYRAGLEALRAKPSALFVSNDYQAIGILRAAHEMAVDVPTKLAVVSFDGTIESEYCWPALTTARQPIRAMADAAVATVLDRAHREPGHQQFAVDLVVRGSCGCRWP